MAITIGIKIPSGKKPTREALYAVLASLVAIDLEYLRAHPDTPLLSRSGVRYRREPPGREDWQTIADILQTRFADCEDLASWRVAEARYRGFKSFPYLTEKNGLWHVRAAIFLKKSQRWIVTDPSKETGM